MEGCALTKGYEAYLSQWAQKLPATSHSLRIVSIACTTVDVLRVLGCLEKYYSNTIDIALYRPLGDAEDLYKSWNRDFKYDDAFSENLERTLECRFTVLDDVEFENLENNSVGLVVFGPLSFERSSGTFKTLDVSIIQSACTKLHHEGGRLLFCIRGATEWQEFCMKGKLPSTISSEIVKTSISTLSFDVKEVPIAAQLLISEESLDAVVRVNNSEDGGFDKRNLIQNLSAFAEKSGKEDLCLNEIGSLFIVKTLAIEKKTSEESQSTNEEEETKMVLDKSLWWPNGQDGEFYNVGEHIWKKQRQEWLKPRGEKAVSNTAPIPYDQVLSGLASVRRTYELPHPIRLADIIDLYLDIWETQDGY